VRSIKKKSHVTKQLEKFFKASNRIETFILYYTGHGNDLGDWVFEDGEISLRDILANFEKRSNPSKNRNYDSKQSNFPVLVIISDCCYSGKWIEEMTEYHTSKKMRVVLVTACNATQKAKQLVLTNGLFVQKSKHFGTGTTNLCPCVER